MQSEGMMGHIKRIICPPCAGEEPETSGHATSSASAASLHAILQVNNLTLWTTPFPTKEGAHICFLTQSMYLEQLKG